MTITGERAAATGERVAATGEREVATGEGEIASGERPAAMSDASAEVGSAFKGLMAAVRRLRGRETRSHCGLSDAQYGLLLGLREHDQLSSRELAGLAILSPATTTEML